MSNALPPDFTREQKEKLWQIREKLDIAIAKRRDMDVAGGPKGPEYWELVNQAAEFTFAIQRMHGATLNFFIN